MVSRREFSSMPSLYAVEYVCVPAPWLVTGYLNTIDGVELSLVNWDDNFILSGNIAAI